MRNKSFIFLHVFSTPYIWIENIFLSNIDFFILALKLKMTELECLNIRFYGNMKILSLKNSIVKLFILKI